MIQYWAQNNRLRSSFSPTGIPGLALWLDASDTATITLDGSNNVSQWNDKSGNGKHATQATTLNRPSGTATISGLGAIGFDGTNDCLQVASLALPSSITIFLVYTQTNSTTKLFFMEHSADAAANDGVFVYGSIPSTTIRRSGAATSNTPAPQTPTQGTAARQTTVMFDRTLAADGKIARFWRDGTESTMVASGTNSGVTVASSTATTTLNIGSRNGGASLPFQGSLGDLLIYDSALSSTNRQAVEAYLKAKWGTP